MSNIFYELAKQDQLNAVMMVNHPQQVKVYRQIVKKLGVGDDETVVKPTHFINKYDEDHKVDVAFIDEAHLLWTKQNQGYHGHGDNQLLDILQRAKVVLAVYDHKQVLTADEIMENEDWQQIKRLAGDKVIRLKNQMRIAASDETIRWIRDFIDQRRIFPIPQDDKYDLQVLTILKKCRKPLPSLTRKIMVMASAAWSPRLTGNTPATASLKMAATTGA